MHKNYLKKYYFIEKFEKSNIDVQKKNTVIIYRNYKKKYKIKEIIDLKNFCRKKGLKFLISNNVKLSIKLDLDGAYIPSFNNEYNHLSYAIKRGFTLMGSAHNLKEIRVKEKQRVKNIFISSIFKKNKNYLGLYKFINLKKLTKTDIIALGGINRRNLPILSLTNCYGFAGMSYFDSIQNKKKGPLIKGPLI